MNTIVTPPSGAEVLPAERAAETIASVLNGQRAGDPATTVLSPPGGGKSQLVTMAAAQSRGILGERCMLVTNTNRQAFDLAERIAETYPQVPVMIYARQGLEVPDALRRVVAVVQDPQAFRRGPTLVIANAAKWAALTQTIDAFALQVIDEAFQLTFGRYGEIANLASRVLMIGDPGQIDPIVSCRTERWRCDRDGPHVAAPEALVARHPWVTQLQIPVTYRLVPDTVRFLQPAFYPDLAFTAMSAPGSRVLRLDRGLAPIDSALDVLATGASLAMVELPRKVTGERDAEVADMIAGAVRRLLERQARVATPTRTVAITARDIGVVCTHRVQVAAVQERLGRLAGDVLVETSDRYQGLQRRVMIVHHPLSGRVDASAFHLDAGRACVMLSRHSVACLIVGRAGALDLLRQYPPAGQRALGIDVDSEFGGWQAHVTLLEQLGMENRIVLVRP